MRTQCMCASQAGNVVRSWVRQGKARQQVDPRYHHTGLERDRTQDQDAENEGLGIVIHHLLT